jgi:hypothetical protein
MAKSLDWRYRELARWIESHRSEAFFDARTIHLANPERIEEIDDLIKTYFWPAIKNGVEGTGLRIFGDAVDQVETVDDIHYVARSFNFVLEDPNRPWKNLPNGAMPPWYCRGNLKCSLLSYTLSFDFLIDLPISFSIEKIIQLIRDRRFRGLPPELTVTADPNEQEFYHLAFHNGHGAGFLLEEPAEAAKSVETRGRTNIEIVKCVDRVIENLDSDWAFAQLKKALLTGYEAF